MSRSVVKNKINGQRGWFCGASVYNSLTLLPFLLLHLFLEYCGKLSSCHFCGEKKKKSAHTRTNEEKVASLRERSRGGANGIESWGQKGREGKGGGGKKKPSCVVG